MTRQKSILVSCRRAISLPTSDAAQVSPELDEEGESASPGGNGGSKCGDGCSCATFPSTNKSMWGFTCPPRLQNSGFLTSIPSVRDHFSGTVLTSEEGFT